MVTETGSAPSLEAGAERERTLDRLEARMKAPQLVLRTRRTSPGSEPWRHDLRETRETWIRPADPDDQHPTTEESRSVTGEIEDAINRAGQEAFTKEPPKTLKGQIGFLLKQLGSAKAVAQDIGVTVTADSVNRYRRGAREHARADVAAKIDDAVRKRWQPLVRKRRQRQAATSTGITVETRARFGYTVPVGTTDDSRFRRLTAHLPAAYVQRLFDAIDYLDLDY